MNSEAPSNTWIESSLTNWLQLLSQRIWVHGMCACVRVRSGVACVGVNRCVVLDAWCVCVSAIQPRTSLQSGCATCSKNCRPKMAAWVPRQPRPAVSKQASKQASKFVPSHPWKRKGTQANRAQLNAPDLILPVPEIQYYKNNIESLL